MNDVGGETETQQQMAVLRAAEWPAPPSSQCSSSGGCDPKELLCIHRQNGRLCSLPEREALALAPFRCFLGCACDAEDAHVIAHAESVMRHLCRWWRSVGCISSAADAANEKEMLHNIVRLPPAVHRAMYDRAGGRVLLLCAEPHAAILKMERWLTAQVADVHNLDPWSTAPGDVLGLYGSANNRDLLSERDGTFHDFTIIVLPSVKKDLPPSAAFNGVVTLTTNFVDNMDAFLEETHRVCTPCSLNAQLAYAPPLPLLRLPLNIISVALVTLAQLLRHDRAHQASGGTGLTLSPEVQRLREENEYLLQLVEGDSFTDWRTNLRRPVSLPPLEPAPSGPTNAVRRTCVGARCRPDRVAAAAPRTESSAQPSEHDRGDELESNGGSAISSTPSSVRSLGSSVEETEDRYTTGLTARETEMCLRLKEVEQRAMEGGLKCLRELDPDSVHYPLHKFLDEVDQRHQEQMEAAELGAEASDLDAEASDLDAEASDLDAEASDLDELGSSTAAEGTET